MRYNYFGNINLPKKSVCAICITILVLGILNISFDINGKDLIKNVCIELPMTGGSNNNGGNNNEKSNNNGNFIAGYCYHMPLTISSSNVSGPSSHADFPVLVSITNNSLKSTGNGGKVENSNGYDIRFTDDGGNALDHQLVSYDTSSGEVMAWVEVSSLSPSSNTTIYINYGNSSVSSDQSTSGTWNSNYQSVWSLDQDPNNAAPEMTDWSSNSNHGTKHGSTDPQSFVKGKINKAWYFDGSNDYASFSSDLNNWLGGTATFSAWVKFSETGNLTITNSPGLTGIEEAGGSNDIFWGWIDGQGKIGAQAGSNFGPKSATNINDSHWRHVVITRDASSGEIKLYVDGTLDQTATSDQGTKTNSFHSLGRIEDTGGSPEYFRGNMDEVRIETIIRPAGWIQTQYTNQNNPSSFVSVGSEESSCNCGSPLSVSLANKSDATCHGGSDGSIDIDVSGGAKPYSFNWSNSATSEDLSNIATGSYSVTVTEDNGCSTTGSFSVNQPNALSLSFSTSVDTSNSSATCDADPVSSGFAFKANHTIKTMVQDSAEMRSRLSLDATAIGPALADFNQNGINDLVLLDNKDTIQLWDKLAGLHTTIDISADPAHTDKSLLAVGHWNGSGSSIFYADADLKEIYRVKPNQSPSKVIKAGNGTIAVAGIADIDGDNANELVFVDASQEIRYIDDDQSVSTTGVTIGSNNGIGIGRPIDYNGNGKASIPAVGGGNEILMLGPNGNRETILSGSATKTPIAPVDVDCDNEHELIFRNTNNQLRYIEDVRGTNTVKTFVDDNGNQVVVDQTGIINTGLSNADFGKGSASVSVSGGTSPYSYSWSNGVNGQSIDGINDGSYSVTVTDSNNCSSVDSVNVGATNVNCVWDGSESTDWHTGANWSCGSVPASSDSVTIPVDVPNMPLISDTAKSGAITIDSGATVSFSGSGSPFLAVHGDLVSNGSIDYSSGEVKMKGDSKQKITGSDEIKVYNLMIDNSRSSFPQIVLDVNVEVSNELSLTDGNVKTGEDTLSLTNTDASGLTNYSAQSHIVGYFKRHITKNRSEYVFPVGEGTPSTYYQGAIINRDMSDVNWIVSRFEPSLARYDSSKLEASTGEFDYKRLCDEGMWVFEPDQQPSFPGMYDVKLWIDNIDGLTDNLFGIVKRPKGAGASAWGTGNCVLNNPGGKGRLKEHGYALSLMCQSFSEQTAGDGDGTSQPINLINFDAKLKDGDVNLNWTTASEVNNDYFTVQRSTNGYEWKDIAKVDGAGNSSSRMSYSEVDNEPHQGISYYRLKQTDLNGEATHTGIVTIHNKSYEKTDITVYPNPSRGQFNIEMRSNAESIRMSLYNINGELLFKKVLGSSNGHYEGSFNFRDKLSSGVYFIRMTPIDGENSYTEKIRINR